MKAAAGSQGCPGRLYGVKQEKRFDYCDTPKKEIGDVLFEQASKMQAEPLLWRCSQGNHG